MLQGDTDESLRFVHLSASRIPVAWSFVALENWRHQGKVASPHPESNRHTPGRMSSAALHRLGCTKQFVLIENAHVLCRSRKDQRSTTTAAVGSSNRLTRH